MSRDPSFDSWTTFADRYASQLASIERAVAVAGGLPRIQQVADRYLAQQEELQKAFEQAGGAAYIQNAADKYLAQQEELRKAFEQAGGAAYIQNAADKYLAQQEELQKAFERAGGAAYIDAATDTYSQYAAALRIPDNVIGSLEAIIAIVSRSQHKSRTCRISLSRTKFSKQLTPFSNRLVEPIKGHPSKT